MPIEIKLDILNINDSDYNTVILRKFFNMIFISRDGKTLRIYTATAFEGSTNSKVDDKTIPEPLRSGNTPCQLKFSYNISDSKGKIEFEDLTDSLLNQTNHLEKVWGKCTSIGNQNLLKVELESLFPTQYPKGSTHKLPSVSSPLLKFEESEKGDNFIFIGGKGKYIKGNDLSYTLEADRFPGISAINWIRTTISLTESVLTEKMKFIIAMPDQSEVCTPDFTFYFAPPTNFIVDEEITTVEIGAGDKDVKNRVTRVADNTTVDFEEWDKEENIYDCKKSRVGFSKYLSNVFYLSKKQTNIFVAFSNPLKHGNLQFFLGLIVAFLLSYCSDKTFLNDYYSWLDELCCVAKCNCRSFCNLLGILSPFLIILTFMSFVYRRKNCFPLNQKKRYRFLSFSKCIGVILTALFIVYTFVLWNICPKFMSVIICENCKVNTIISFVLLALAFAFNLTYVIYCWGIRKKRFFDYL